MSGYHPYLVWILASSDPAYFLGVLLAAFSGFVCVLAYFDLTPKALLYKLIGYLFEPPAGLRPVKHDAPYRRVRAATNRIHKPILLNLATSDGSGQACHPDVAHIPGGFGARNWTYWMSCTPYPYADYTLENPEIFASFDGLNWDIPDGLQNPLVQKPRNALDHNSDPDLFFHNNELWLFYRETLRSQSPAESRIYLMRSSDGIGWSVPIEVLRETTGTQLLSPSLLHDGSCFRMWTVELRAGELQLMRRRSTDGISWTELPEAAQITGLENGRQPWHIDVIKEKNGLSAVMVSCTKFGGTGSRIHFAHSEDGLSWFAEGFILDQVYEFEANLQYRASLCKADDRSQDYELWYSASSLADVFSIAYLKLVRMENQLVPLESSPLRSER